MTLIRQYVRENKQRSGADGRPVPMLANNISPLNAARIIA